MKPARWRPIFLFQLTNLIFDLQTICLSKIIVMALEELSHIIFIIVHTTLSDLYNQINEIYDFYPR